MMLASRCVSLWEGTPRSAGMELFRGDIGCNPSGGTALLSLVKHERTQTYLINEHTEDRKGERGRHQLSCHMAGGVVPPSKEEVPLDKRHDYIRTVAIKRGHQRRIFVVISRQDRI